MSYAGATLRTFNELYDLRRLDHFNEFIRGTIITTYPLKGGVCRILLEDDSESGLDKSVITHSPFDSFSDKQRLFVTFSPNIANLMSVPSRHVFVSCQLTHRTKCS